MSTALKPFIWFYHEFGIVSIHEIGRDVYLIILARTCRMLAYGTNSLILAIFFAALGYSDHQIGLFMTLTLLGDVFLGTSLTLVADRVGRRRVLVGGSILMVFSGIVFAIFENFWILLLAAVLGVISVTGGDFGPFRSVEESILSELTTPSTRPDVLAWYVTTSTLGSSIGSEISGRVVHFLTDKDGWAAVDAYHALFWMYTAMGLVNVVLVLALTDACEFRGNKGNPRGAQAYTQIPHDDDDESLGVSEAAGCQHDPTVEPVEAAVPATPAVPSRSSGSRAWTTKVKSLFASRNFSQISAPTRSVMYKLWFLLSVDSLADGMVPYSLTNYYMDTKFHPAKSTLGDVTSSSYFLGAVGGVFAGPLARKIGLINTMVFTHVPSSAAVLVFPFPSSFWVTSGLLLLRTSLNNMDQAPRAAFIAAVVKPEERTAVMGITGMLRTLAAMAGPTLTGFLAAGERFWIAFVVAGTCRLAYDLGLYAMFVNTKLHQQDSDSMDKATDESGHRRRRERDDEESIELHRLDDSDVGRVDGRRVENASPEEHSANRGLQVLGGERVRSRSPRRPQGL